MVVFGVGLLALAAMAAGRDGCRLSSCKADLQAVRAPAVATVDVPADTTSTQSGAADPGGVLRRTGAFRLASVLAVLAGLAILGFTLTGVTLRRRMSLKTTDAARRHSDSWAPRRGPTEAEGSGPSEVLERALTGK